MVLMMMMLMLMMMMMMMMMMMICFYIIGDNEYESPITPHHGNYNEIIVFL